MNIPLNQIQVDPNNPRKTFEVTALQSLKESIKKRGIKMPLIVEKIGEHKYQLIDGERRFRSATELKLQEVPAIIEQILNPIDRIITQFHIQEQHENWSGTEKAMAILRLSEETEMPLKELCDAIGVSNKVVSKYLAFSKLIDKKKFVESNIGMEWGYSIEKLKNVARNITQNELHKAFTRSDEKALEDSIVSRSKKGEFKHRSELNKVKDAFVQDPKSIRKFIDDENTTAVGLFSDTGAKSAYALRNARNNAGYLNQHGLVLINTRGIKIDHSTLSVLKKTKDVVNQLIDMAE